MRARAIVAATLVGATALVAAGGSLSAAAAGNAGVHFHKTVASASVSPSLTLTLAVDHPSAIPGDTLTYSGTAANTATTWSITGAFTAESHSDSTSTVVYYWDELQYCLQGCGNGENKYWTSIAAFVAGNPGYTPVQAPDVVGGMVLTAVGAPATGVTYPATGDGILGSTVAAGATATWAYQALVTLTPAQVALLSDPTKVQATRNLAHFEVTTTSTVSAAPWSDSATFTNSFTATAKAGDATGLVVKVTEPDGSTVNVTIGTLAPGTSAPYSTTFIVPVPAPKAAGETDAAYLSRLIALEGALLTGSATVSGTGSSGAVTAPAPPPVVTVEHVPAVTIAKSGPASVDAGADGIYQLALANIGGATAGPLQVTDSVPGGATGTVTGVPATLSATGTAGDTATATATFPVPASQPAGSLTDTATVAWQDANHNPYGPVSSQFTTEVRNKLLGARLTLAPESAGPNVPGTTQTLTATLLDRNGNPIAGQLVTFHVTGANPGSGTATTDANGHADFTYTGANPGNDVVQATATAQGVTVNSNTSTVSWSRQLQRVAITPIQGNFFTNSANSCTFDAGPGSTPVFGQTFPDILFNPTATVVPHDISTVNNFTRPFTDLTVDINGNYNGQIVAQGNGQQAGTGALINFYGVFTGNLLINEPGDLTFRILHDDGYIFGVGNGANRVSGDFEGNPPATTPFNGYGVVAAWNTGSTGSSNSGPATVHFPAAGSYPFELDYTECSSGPLFLDLITEQFTAQTDPLSVYVGYADGLRPGGSTFPFPWQGSPNVIFEGGGCCDNGAFRFDNSGTTPITFDQVTVDVGVRHYDLWPRSLTLPPGQIMIFTGTAGENFDTSDASSSPCNVNDGVIPRINVTIGGATTAFQDTQQVLNTGGFDLACLRNESTSWQRIAGTADTINVPLPPAASLDISPFTVPGALLGQNQALTVSAMDGGGNPVGNLAVTLQVFGPNARTLTATTSAGGLAVFGYVGTHAGTDSIQANAFIAGLRAISNLGSVTWTAPLGGGPDPGPNPDPNAPPPPSITAPAPADGTVVTKPVSVTASIAPPAGQTIATWRVFYQALDPGPQVVIASGSGTPPATLATFDPTVLVNDAYGITVEATASGGGIQDVTTTVTVLGTLKPGRYVTTYEDLSVPVGGFQMEVRRTYDSIDKSSGDFGVGWRVSISNFRVAPNRVLGAGGWTQYNKQCFIGLCFTGFQNSAPRFAIVTFPDQHTEVFDFTPSGGTNLFWECAPAFTPDAALGTTSTLIPLDDTACSYVGDGNIYGAGGRPYDPQRFQLTTRDGRKLVLDRARGLVSESDLSGNSLTIDSGGVHSTIGPASSPTAGPSINFTRDGANRITYVTGPLAGQHIHYAYSGNELAAVTDPNGNTATYVYDPATGDLQKSLDPNNQPLQTLGYDSTGRLIAIANGSEPATVISTDPGLHRQTILDPNGKLTTVLVYDDLGDVIERDDSFGGSTLKTTFSYDAVGRMTSVTDPLLHTSSVTYDESPTSANGNVLSVFANGRTWTLENYNAFGEPGLIRKPDGSVLMVLTYDSVTAAVTSTQAPGQPQTSFAYWPGGGLKSVTDPGGRSVNFTYDANGNLASIGDSQGQATRVSIDSGGMIRSVTDETGNQTKFDYYADGSLKTLTDANLNKTQYSYDSLLRLHQVEDALGHSTLYDYNDLGLLQQRTDRNGAVTTFTYDVDGLLTREARPNSDVTTFAHDPLGRLIGADNASAHIDRTYDDAGRLTSETSCAATGSATAPCSAAAGGSQPRVTLSYDYFADDQLKTVTSSDAGVPAVRLGYEAIGRLASVQYGSQAAFSLGYDALGRVSTLSRPNGITDTFSYNASGDLTGRDASLNGSLIARFDYGIDPVTGRRTSITDNAGTHNYSYYANGWLESATHPATSGLANESYTYDAAGNRSLAGVPTRYDAANRLVSDGTYNYTFDAEGNMRSKTPVGGGPGTTYTWNADHQLLGIAYPDGTRSTYRYDPFGRRIAAVEAGHETRFVNDGLSVEADYNSQNQLQASYVSGLESLSQGQAAFYIADAQGSVRSLTDSGGAAVGNSAYDSFGVPAPGNPAAARETFTGYQHDPLSGLYYAGARYYDPSSGRFLSEDPVPATNPYPYAVNDPTNLIDLYGMQATGEYAELLSIQGDNAQCVAGEVAAVTGPSLAAASAALAGGVPTEAAVAAEIAGGLVANEAQCVAGALASRGSGVRPVRGRMPINSRYAGGVHPSGVRYNERGFPNFAPYARATVRVEGLTGAMWHDEPLANAAAGLSGTPDGYVWHHVEDCVTMQLIPQAIHDVARHTGGAAVINAGEC